MSGIPTGAATTVTVRKIPTIINTSPIAAKIIRPVRPRIKVSRLHRIFNGQRNREMMLDTGYLFSI